MVTTLAAVGRWMKEADTPICRPAASNRPRQCAAVPRSDDWLLGVPQPNGSWMAERERRLRLAWLKRAESWSREASARGLTAPQPSDMALSIREPDRSAAGDEQRRSKAIGVDLDAEAGACRDRPAAFA